MVQLYRRKGGDMLVNTQTASHQSAADIAVLPGGYYVVAWADSSLIGGDSSSHGIKAQRFDSDGNKAGGEFLVNSTTAGNQSGPAVATLASGRFVVTWNDPSATGGDTSASAVRGQMFEADGTPVGAEFLINTQTNQNQIAPAVTGLAGGGFVVSWTDSSLVGGDSSSTGIKAQVFDAAGARVGGEFLVNTGTSGSQSASSLIALPSGGFAAVWSSIVFSSPAQGAIQLQLFDSAGAKVGGELVVNGLAGVNFSRPNIAALPDGFLVTWSQQDNPFGSPVTYDVRAQKFDLTGAKVGDEFVVHTQSTGSQFRPDAFALPGGGYIVTWEGPGEGEPGYNVFGQVFDSAGARIGVEFVVSSGTTGDQLSPKVGVLPSGDIVVTWSVDSTIDGDGSGFAVRSTILTLSSEAPTDIALSPGAVSETATENVAVATLSATGAVNSIFTFELLDDAGGAFRIEGDRLVVADNALLDFETDPEMNVTVRATDLNGLTYTEILTVAISDTLLEKRFSMGPEFRVNVDQSGIEVNAIPIPLSTGGFAILFSQIENGPQGTATRIRFFDADGTPTSGDIALDDRSWFDVSVTPLANGGFLTARSAPYEPDFTQSLRVQAWDSAGNPVGPETVLDPATGYLPVNSSAVLLSNGGYFVAWQGENASVSGQLFGADGVPVGNSFLLAPNHTGYQFAIAPAADGGFAVSRLKYASGPEGTHEIRTQLYNSAGVATVAPVSVTIAYTDYLSMTLVALEGGGHVLGWRELAGGQHEVKAQIIGADGLAVGGPLLLATTPADYSGNIVQFLAHPDGGFFAAWPVVGGDFALLNGQLYDFSGQPVGDFFDPIERNGSLAILADGTIVAAWYDEDSHQVGSYARLYKPSDAPLDLSGDNVLTGDGGSNLLDGQGGNDQLFGLGGGDELIGGTGNDLLDGGAGADAMTGGSGDDVYVVDDAGDLVIEAAGEGNDGIRTSLAGFSLVAHPDIENLTGTASTAQILRGNSGNNVITGGAGSDVLRLYDGGDDNVLGGAGSDNIFFIGSLTSADVVNGGSETDTLVLQGPYGALTLTANITHIENISLLGGNNTNFGEPGTNRYDYGITTHDSNFAAGLQVRINGAALLADEDFTFDGSAETDAKFVVYGGKGVDTLTGGLGNDIFFYAEDGRFASGDTVNGGAGYDGMFLRGNYTIDFNAPGYTGLFTNIENLTLTSATDERYARGGGTEFDYNLTLSNAIVKPGETLTVSGALLMATETMILDASQEADGLLRLFGGRADDTLKGGANADLLHGNLGADVLTGNGGADTFRFDSTADSNSVSMDQILDFMPGPDKIDLSRIDANSIAAGDQAFSWIHLSAFSGTAGELRAQHLGGQGWLLQGDTDGNGVADFVVMMILPHTVPPSAGDFIL